jgi:hypothetical protein
MKSLLIFAGIVLGTLVCVADGNYVILTTEANTNATFQLQQGQTAEIVGSGNVYSPSTQSPTLRFQISSNTYYWNGGVIVGPASISVAPSYTGYFYVASYATLKISPSTYDVQKTVIVPPGTNQVNVSLQTSTNLVDWADATNGVYGSPNMAAFFRIKMATAPTP